MNKTQLEAWTLQIIDHVNAGQRIEDSRVELKSVFIEPVKAARRLAAHANASRGEPILWLIGIDEGNGVTGVHHADLADWYAAVQKQFDTLAPTLFDLNVPIGTLTVTALFFETDRAPFVVKNPDGGAIQFEVPWRDGTRVRSANRADLLRILVPLQAIPEIEILSGSLIAFPQKEGTTDVTAWRLDMELYVIPTGEASIVIPFHRCHAEMSYAAAFTHQVFENIRLAPLYPPGIIRRGLDSPPVRAIPLSETIAATPSELLIRGPGLVKLTASGSTSPIMSFAEESIQIGLFMQPVNTNHRIELICRLEVEQTPPNLPKKWII